MFSCLVFDYIIMGTISKNEFPHPTAGTDFVFTQIDSNIICMYRGSLQDFYWKKGKFRPRIKNDTSSGNMDEKIDR